jgi:hypothetical protein
VNQIDPFKCVNEEIPVLIITESHISQNLLDRTFGLGIIGACRINDMGDGCQRQADIVFQFSLLGAQQMLFKQPDLFL